MTHFKNIRGILPLSVTHLFYILAVSWNMIKILALRSIPLWPTPLFLYMKWLDQMCLKIVSSYCMGLVNKRHQEDTRRQERSEVECMSPGLLLVGWPWIARVLSLKAVASVRWQLFSLDSGVWKLLFTLPLSA